MNEPYLERRNADTVVLRRLPFPLLGAVAWIIFTAALGGVLWPALSASWLLLAVYLSAGAFMVGRALRQRVEVDPRGVAVHGLLRTHRMPWLQLDQVELGVAPGLYFAPWFFVKLRPKSRRPIVAWASASTDQERAGAFAERLESLRPMPGTARS